MWFMWCSSGVKVVMWFMSCKAQLMRWVALDIFPSSIVGAVFHRCCGDSQPCIRFHLNEEAFNFFSSFLKNSTIFFFFYIFINWPVTIFSLFSFADNFSLPFLLWAKPRHERGLVWLLTTADTKMGFDSFDCNERGLQLMCRLVNIMSMRSL